jgi:hypothetical protein
MARLAQTKGTPGTCQRAWCGLIPIAKSARSEMGHILWRGGRVAGAEPSTQLDPAAGPPSSTPG